MCAAALAGDLPKARELNFKLLGLHTKLFVEANPIPVKWAVAQMGLIGMGIRLPLTPLSQPFHEVVREAMRQADIKLSSGLRVVEGKTGLTRYVSAIHAGALALLLCACGTTSDSTKVDYKSERKASPARSPSGSDHAGSRRALPDSRHQQVRRERRSRRTTRSAAWPRSPRRPGSSPRSTRFESSGPRASAGWWCPSRPRRCGRSSRASGRTRAS